VKPQNDDVSEHREHLVDAGSLVDALEDVVEQLGVAPGRRGPGVAMVTPL